MEKPLIFEVSGFFSLKKSIEMIHLQLIQEQLLNSD
jgi:hypothetical protein